ncbi:MAG: hypothetical protein ACK4IT_01855 [Thioalkalivibrionaceae bacterium]
MKTNRKTVVTLPERLMLQPADGISNEPCRRPLLRNRLVASLALLMATGGVIGANAQGNQTTASNAALAEASTSESSATPQVRGQSETERAQTNLEAEARAEELEARIDDLAAERDAAIAERDTARSEMRSETGELEAAIAAAEQSRDEALSELERARADAAARTAELEAARSAAEQSRDEALSELERARADATARTAELEARINDLVAERDALDNRLLAAERSAADATAQLEVVAAERSALAASVPISLGGELTSEQVASDAARLADEARSLRRDDPRQRELLAELRNTQVRLADLTGAAGVYRVRAGDTLAIVAARTLGNSNRWPELFAANQHILLDPDQLESDWTLITP